MIGRTIESWRAVRRHTTLSVMVNTDAEPGLVPSPSVETTAEKQRRIAWEAAGIAEARAQLDAGLFVASEDIDAWIDSLGTDHELPPPATRHR